MGKLVSDKQIAALRKIGVLGMQTDVRIMKRTLTSSAYGDNDLESHVYAETVVGWLRAVPATEISVSYGQAQAPATHRLFVPVGTDVAAFDVVEIGGEEFHVVDTNVESTYKVMLRCSLRKSE